MRIRITTTPVETEIDGIPLGAFIPGSVRNVSSALALWLIAQGYAEAEMREQRSPVSEQPSTDRRRDAASRYPDRRKSRS